MIWIINILALNLLIVLVTEIAVSISFGAKTAKQLVIVALVNIITNPAVVLTALCLTIYLNQWRNIGIVILEIFAVITEGFIFSKFKTFGRKNPYLISMVMNMVSFMTGELIKLFL